MEFEEEAISIEYTVVSGYVAVLLGRSRATEDIDVITEPFSKATATELAGRLREVRLTPPRSNHVSSISVGEPSGSFISETSPAWSMVMR
jgi:hypothetical protein